MAAAVSSFQAPFDRAAIARGIYGWMVGGVRHVLVNTEHQRRKLLRGRATHLVRGLRWRRTNVIASSKRRRDFVTARWLHEVEMGQSRSGRVAIYFAPPVDSPLYQFGSACLGRDAVSGDARLQPDVDGVSPDRWREISASPRAYGFHATMKPPFHLSAERTREQLVSCLERFAAVRAPFTTPPLRLARISRFVALVLRKSSPALEELAAACVRDFDGFRAPSAPEELARRGNGSLTLRQRELLAAWGYPYVLDEWRFHMTLASGVDRDEAERVCRGLEPLAATVCRAELRVDAVCLFEQPAVDAPFTLIRRFPFGPSAAGQ